MQLAAVLFSISLTGLLWEKAPLSSPIDAEMSENPLLLKSLF
jgi:hypothetical protein